MQVIDGTNICDECLGRVFLDEEGKNNAERGRKVRKRKGLEECVRCEYCGGFFDRVDDVARRIAEKMRGFVFETFRVGSVVPPELIKKEEELWETFGVTHTETLKKNVNRVVGKKVQEITGKKYSEEPDVEVIVDVGTGEVTVTPLPLYIYGRYRKYAHMPQTKWPCRHCGGKGCEACEYTGRQWRETVEYYVSDVLLGLTLGKESKFHAAGREDIDARMLGDGRPFVIEIIYPRKRKVDLDLALREINAHGAGKIEVLCLLPSSKKEVRELKAAKYDKTYRALVEFERDVGGEEVKAVERLSGQTVLQETPSRIEHRKRRKTAKKKVKSVKVLGVDGNVMDVEITAESGLYIKELVSGDGGRTTPSFSEVTGIKCKVLRLDIVKVHGGRECSRTQ